MSPAVTIVALVFAWSLYLGYLATRPERPDLLNPHIWDADPVIHKRNYVAAMNAYRAEKGLPPLATSPRRFWQFWRKREDDTIWGDQCQPEGRAHLS